MWVSEIRVSLAHVHLSSLVGAIGRGLSSPCAILSIGAEVLALRKRQKRPDDPPAGRRTKEQPDADAAAKPFVELLSTTQMSVFFGKITVDLPIAATEMGVAVDDLCWGMVVCNKSGKPEQWKQYCLHQGDAGHEKFATDIHSKSLAAKNDFKAAAKRNKAIMTYKDAPKSPFR